MSENAQSGPLGLLEPRAEELAQQLHGIAASGTKVSDAALLTPMLTSMAISAKRQADAMERIAKAQEKQAEWREEHWTA